MYAGPGDPNGGVVLAPAVGVPVVTVPYSKAWFPGYDASVEENSNRRCWNFILLLIIGFLALASILVGIFVMRPGVEFQRFELGQCTLEKLTFKEYQSCSCGDKCQSSFPCYQLFGTFKSEASNSGVTKMEFSKSFWDYDKGCAWSSCERNDYSNRDAIYKEAVEFYRKHGYDYSKLHTSMYDLTRTTGDTVDTLNDTVKLQCYGDNKGYSIMEYLDSSVWIGCGTIPLILFVISIVVFYKCATPGMQLSVSRWLCLPYFFIKDSKTTTTYLCGPCR